MLKPLFRFSKYGCNIYRYYSNNLHSQAITDNSAVLVPRTDIKSPSEQALNMSSVLGKFVNYPKEPFSTFMEPFLKAELIEELNVFGDLSLLMRKPALSIVQDLMKILNLQNDALKNTNELNPDLILSHTVPKFVGYGQPGTGLSITLAQVCYYAGLSDWIIFPFNNAEEWLEPCFDLTPSSEIHYSQHCNDFEGQAFDFPVRSAAWLRIFFKMNENILNRIQPTLTRSVEWTVKDSMPVGTPWIELINFAITRTIYATDCIGILLREMRTLSSLPDGPPTLILVDGINFLWCRGARLKDRTLFVKIHPKRLAIVHHLKRAMQGDWRKGAIVATTNIRGSWPTDREKYSPGYLLGKEGFQHMDPFIPILVSNYESGELHTMLSFYAHHNWITNPAAQTPEGLAEIKFLADNNPLELNNIVAEW